jgi:hypothetical protein
METMMSLKNGASEKPGNYPATRARNSAGVRMRIPPKECNVRRSLSPVTMILAFAAYAVERTTSSLGSRIFGISRNSTSETTETMKRYFIKSSSAVYPVSRSRYFNFRLQRVSRNSSRSGSDEKSATCPAEAFSSTSVGGPPKRKPETITFVSRTIRIVRYFFFRVLRRTSWTISQISSMVNGGRLDGESARLFISGPLIRFKTISSSDWKRRKSLPFFKKDAHDFGKVRVRSSDTLTTTMDSPPQSKYHLRDRQYNDLWMVVNETRRGTEFCRGTKSCAPTEFCAPTCTTYNPQFETRNSTFEILTNPNQRSFYG